MHIMDRKKRTRTSFAIVCVYSAVKQHDSMKL